MTARYCLGLCALVLCAAVFAGQPPPAPAVPPSSAPPPSPDESDEEFIEFLGADDVGDAAWWEFLKKTAPPPQDANQ